MQLPPKAFWIENHWVAQEKPKQWRTLSVDTLFMSGSASPSLKSLYWLKKQYGQHRTVFLIDLRQETHLYTDGLPISIYDRHDQINWGKSPETIHTEEQAWRDYIAIQKKITLSHLGKPVKGMKGPVNPFTIPVESVYLEKTAATMANMQYRRIEVPDFHPPSPAQVDQYLEIFKSLPKNYWLHFHCAGGKGRTSTFLALTDIIINHKKVSLADIVKRQALSGGINLLDDSIVSLHEQPWKQPYKTARKDFIQLFYQYASTAYPEESFTKWLTRQPKSTYVTLLQTDAYFHS